MIAINVIFSLIIYFLKNIILFWVRLLDQIFNQLDVANKLSECTVVFGHSYSLSFAERKKVMQVLFEEKHVHSCWLVVNASLALAVAGETSGLVVDVGSKRTILYPVYEMNVVSFCLCFVFKCFFSLCICYL
jgi:hypothetical protein